MRDDVKTCRKKFMWANIWSTLHRHFNSSLPSYVLFTWVCKFFISVKFTISLLALLEGDNWVDSNNLRINLVSWKFFNVKQHSFNILTLNLLYVLSLSPSPLPTLSLSLPHSYHFLKISYNITAYVQYGNLWYKHK